MRLIWLWATLRRARKDVATLEQRVVLLEQKLEEERARNVERENYLISQVLTAAGRYGLPKSVDPPKPQPIVKPVAPELTGLQKATIAAVKADGEARGKSQREIQEVVDAIARGEKMPVLEDA